MPPRAITLLPLEGIPEIAVGDDLARHIVEAALRTDVVLASGDVVVVTQKIVSKAEGRVVRLDEVVPSALAIAWAGRFRKDARVVELVLREAVRVVRMTGGVLIAETRQGFICANAGVDTSNVASGHAALHPCDPDASARRIRQGLRAAAGIDIGVVISDTFGRPWREGQTNVAIGLAGVAPVIDHRGMEDSQGRRLESTLIAVADEIASAAELAMGKTRNVPVVVVRGLGPVSSTEGHARQLIRPAERDLFR